MAKVLGETGRYVTEQSTDKFLRIFLFLYLFAVILAFISGYVIGVNQNYLTLIFIVVAILVWKYLSKKIKSIEKERLAFRKGATGEALVGFLLDGFPDDFRIIHDLSTPYGNIDHIVIGPTGAFVIDTKNWKGIVSSDGSGELLLNGKSTNKPEIKNFTRRIMAIKEKAKILSSLDTYVQGIFVFPSAYLEAKWGSTGYVHCIKDEQLYDYIVENKKSTKLSAKEIGALSQSFLALARMDKGFEGNSR
ncbi:MAG: NERD domain-containing protein [Nitrospirae bacterium]|nr:NERD domain-containing protein [Nitrospirota bacterium]